jgi:hypothetical protein
MAIVLPHLPVTAPGEKGPYCVIAKHRALPGMADAYERRMLADLEATRAETGALQFTFIAIAATRTSSSSMKPGETSRRCDGTSRLRTSSNSSLIARSTSTETWRCRGSSRPVTTRQDEPDGREATSPC